jgi:hypothetical protein
MMTGSLPVVIGGGTAAGDCDGDGGCARSPVAGNGDGVGACARAPAINRKQRDISDKPARVALFIKGFDAPSAAKFAI